ncbi:folylpolyglutamate synthase/dihydrofolate synthase family protein [Sphingorhabdus sp.]|uniref:bifunctional folylpolyglutamate synthase/dihydrofolate synthase n=1 Tax=Sphingorhabdus sp. TaxID=1902408 RepID=UPI003593488F
MPDHAISTDSAVQAQLDRLTMLSPGRDVLGLERIAALLDRLGNPHHHLPPVFHVAGTNGKGSTCAFLRSAIEATGMTTHVYSSPHLVRFNERIRVAGRLIEDGILASLLTEVLDHAEGLQASFFEVTTAVAFLAFARTPADACIVEVGLGGRLDATNVLVKPVACGIASLGIDHEAFLLAPEVGTPNAPLDRIAFEKAGIAKAGSPLLTQKYTASMSDTILETAARTGAKLMARGTLWDAAAYEGRLHYRDENGKLTLHLPRMSGSHQADNAALAIAMLRHQTALNIPEAALSAAMEWTRWPARMQLLAAGPVTAQLPENSNIWLDGGHNPDAGDAIAKTLESGPQVHVILGMLKNKDAMGFIKPFAAKIVSLHAVPVPGHEHHDPEDLCRLVQDELGIVNASPVNNVSTALARIAAEGQPGDLLICGSLYLAGEVLRANNQIPD